FILSPTSLTEFPAYWCEHPDEFAAISSGKTPEERAKLVLRWFILTLKCQYATRNEKMGSEKKPLNPILGETFYGSWPDSNGRGKTDLIVEQVSHHPPITAYYINNEKAGVSLEGHSGQKTSFSAPSIVVKQVGHAIITVKLEDGNAEEYLITLPRLKIDGILYGKPYIELTEVSYIVGSNGTSATIDYKGKGWLSGKAHSYKATLTNGSSTISQVEGQWTGLAKDSKGDLNFDAQMPKEEVNVKPIEEQQLPESRLVWKEVAEGIRNGNYDKAGKAKSQIENDQRAKRKDEAAESKKHELKHFNQIASDESYAKLIKQVSSTLPPTEEGYKLKRDN
ncbi:oxysterol binding protein, partial [Wallemia mellicola]